MNMTLSLSVLISVICSDKGNDNDMAKCRMYMHQCISDMNKKQWATEYTPEVKKVKTFLHCAHYEGWGRK